MRALALAMILLPVLPAHAQTLEQVVTIPTENGDVIGTITLPAQSPAPAVLLLHGFTGSRDELMTDAVPEGVFAYSAQVLADAGYASLRIDFRGSGESLADIDFAQTTFEGQIADALAAADWLRADPRVDADDIYLIGWSQGGLVAAATAGRDGDFDAVALWAAVATPPETYGGFLGAEVMEAGRAAAPDEPVAVTLPWAEIELNGAFFDGIDSADPLAEIAAYPGPLLVAHGSDDATVPPGDAVRYLAAHDGPETLWAAEMDHVFNAFETIETLDAMLAATQAFFADHAD